MNPVIVLHVCPVCGQRHEVHGVLDRLAYGRQLTCSPSGKTVFPSIVRARVLGKIAQITKESLSRRV